MKTAIVGGGKGCRSLLEFILERGLVELELDVRLVCDVRAWAPGLLYAAEKGIATSTRVEDAYRVAGLELVVELTGDDQAARDLYEHLPPGVRMMDHVMARLFWDLIKVEADLRDQRALLTVCTPVRDIAGVPNVTVSLPHLVGGQGILDTILLPLSLNETEETALRASAKVVKEAYESVMKV